MMKITIQFSDGEQREYNLTGDVVSKIKQGEVFNVRSIHPSYGELMVVTVATNREQRAEMLIRDLFMKCKKSQNINQHNPYTWAELNRDLMHRLKEFM